MRLLLEKAEGGPASGPTWPRSSLVPPDGSALVPPDGAPPPAGGAPPPHRWSGEVICAPPGEFLAGDAGGAQMTSGWAGATASN
jgi:hypothetical protein